MRIWKGYARKVSAYVPVMLILFLQACGGGAGSGGGNDPGGGSFQLDSVGNKSVMATGTLSFQVSVSDPDGDGYSLVADGTANAVNPLTPGMATFNEQTGQLTWNTELADAGTYSITFTVANNITSETDTETITISVDSDLLINHGESLYVQHCQSCHGVNGFGGTRSQVRGFGPYSVRAALGMEGGSAPSGMGSIAAQFNDQVRDANAIGFFLCDVGGVDFTNATLCPVN